MEKWTKNIEEIKKLHTDGTKKYVANNGMVLYEYATGCHEKGHPILTYNGEIKAVEDIQYGDILMGDDHTPRFVLNLIRGKQQMYMITPNKGESFRVNEDHVLHLKRTTVEKARIKKHPEFEHVTVKEYLAWNKYKKHLYKLEYSSCIDFNVCSPLSIPPRLLGMWLGDGISKINSISIVTEDFVLKEYCKGFCDATGMQYKESQKRGDYCRMSITNNRKPSKLLTSFHNLGLRKGKFIPDSYLVGSVDERLMLLAGLLDTDGYLDNNSIYEIVQKNIELGLQIVQLAKSLGFRATHRIKVATMKRKDGSIYKCDVLRVIISGDVKRIPVLIERKKVKHANPNKNHLLTGFKVIEDIVDDYYGFTIDENHLYIDGNFMIHHNSGKSKQAIDNILLDDEWWLILCAEIAHIKNWTDEFIKWGAEDVLKRRVHLICYASLKSYFRTVGDDYKINIIADEAHHMFAPIAFPIVTKHAAKLQMLTATMPSEHRARFRSNDTLKKVKRVVLTLSEAIRRGILPQPKIYIVPVPFDSFSRTEVITKTKGGKVRLKKVPPLRVPYDKFKMHIKGNAVYNLEIMATQSEKLEYYNNQVAWLQGEYMKDKQEWVKNRWVQAGSVRKRFIANVKTPFAKTFIEKFVGNKRAIIFCGSIAQAKELGGDMAIHSQLTAKQSRLKIEAFQNGDTDRMYTNKMLREGMNLVGIQVVVVIQLDNKNLAFVQMAGRGLRADSPELFIMNIPNSQDDKYLKSSLAGVSEQYIQNIDMYGIEEVIAPKQKSTPVFKYGVN